MLWLSKYEEKNLPKNFGMQNMKGTRHASQEMDMKPMNADVILLAGSRYTRKS
jgi:hypothetical protein